MDINGPHKESLINSTFIVIFNFILTAFYHILQVTYAIDRVYFSTKVFGQPIHCCYLKYLIYWNCTTRLINYKVASSVLLNEMCIIKWNYKVPTSTMSLKQLFLSVSTGHQWNSNLPYKKFTLLLSNICRYWIDTIAVNLL